MNLRDFKKDVEYVIGNFVDDCSLFLAINPDKNSDKVSELISEAVDLYNELKDKANKNFASTTDKKALSKEKKEWFKSLRKQLLEGSDACYQKLSELIAEKNK